MSLNSSIFMIAMSPNTMLALKPVCYQSDWWQESVKSLGETRPIMNSESANQTGDSMYEDHRELTPSCTMCLFPDWSEATLTDQSHVSHNSAEHDLPQVSST